MTLPADQAIARFKENEERLDKFVNDAVGYITSDNVNVKSIQAFLNYILSSNGVLGFATQADLYADLAHNANTLAYVTNDPTSSKNGFYIKLGASGSGSWQQASFDRLALAEAAITVNQQRAVPAGQNDDIMLEAGLSSAVDPVVISGAYSAATTFTGTFAGWGNAITYSTPFDAIALYIQVENQAQTVIVRLKTSAMVDVVSVRKQIYKSGWHLFHLGVTHTNVTLGGAVFYVCFESVGHTARLMMPTIISDAAVLADTAAYPQKYTAAADAENVWHNTTTQVYPMLVKFYQSALGFGSRGTVDFSRLMARNYDHLRGGPTVEYTALTPVYSATKARPDVLTVPFSGWSAYYSQPAGAEAFNAIRIPVIGRDMSAYDRSYRWTALEIEIRSTTHSGTLIASGRAEVNPDDDVLFNVLIPLLNPISGATITLDGSNLPAVYSINLKAINRDGLKTAICGAPLGTISNYEGHSYYYRGDTNQYVTYTGNPCLGFESVLLTSPVFNKFGSTYASKFPRIVLPPNLRLIAGREFSIYFDNLIPCDADSYFWDVATDIVGEQQNERWVFETDSDASETLTLSIHEKTTGRKISEAVTTAIVKQDTVANGKNPKCLFMGDSTTAAGTYTGELLTLAAADVIDITLLGSQGSAPNLHEGYSGKTVSWFATNASSPFVFTGAFNFPLYMNGQGYAAVDYVFIHLGINDVFAKTSDTETAKIIDTAFDQLDTMIASIQSFDANIKIGIMVTIPPSATQDAFGANYDDGQTQWRYRRNNWLWSQALILHFANSEADGIYLLPTNCNLDTVHNMQVAVSAPANSRTTTEVVRQSNGVHPAASGYYQMADVVYSFLKHMEA